MSMQQINQTEKKQLSAWVLRTTSFIKPDDMIAISGYDGFSGTIHVV